MRTDDLSQAMMVTTTIAAMQFDVQLLQRSGAPMRNTDDPAAFRGPFTVSVRPDDWPDLRDVLDEIIREQAEFDSRLAARGHRTLRLSRVILFAAILLVALLAILGVINL